MQKAGYNPALLFEARSAQHQVHWKHQHWPVKVMQLIKCLTFLPSGSCCVVVFLHADPLICKETDVYCFHPVRFMQFHNAAQQAGSLPAGQHGNTIQRSQCMQKANDLVLPSAAGTYLQVIWPTR